MSNNNGVKMTKLYEYSYSRHRSMLKLQVMWMIEDEQIPEMTEEQLENFLDSIKGIWICQAIDQGLKELVEGHFTKPEDYNKSRITVIKE